MKKIIISVSALFLVFCMLAAFFLLSSSGLQFGIQWVASLTENKIRIDNTTGRLIGPMMFEGVYIHSPQNSLFINKLTVNWRPMGLLQNQLHILELIVEGIEYTMKQQSLDDPDAREPQLPNSAVVIPFIVDKAVFTDIGILSFTGEKKAFIEQISSSLSGGKEGISIDDLSVQAPGYRIDSQMHLQLSEAWTIRSQGAWHVVRTGCSEMGGAFAVSGPLDDLQISLSTHEPGTIDIQGSLSWAAGEVNWSVDGSGQDMVLPDICPDWPDLTNNMVFHTEGNIDDYRITLDAKISPPDMPLLSVELDVKGNSDGLVIAESPVTFDESRSLLTGQIQWGEIVSWSAIISTESLDFSPYQDVVAGDADFELDITGTIDESTLMYEAHISQLRLSVDEFSEEVTGAIRLHGDLQGAEVVEARITTGKEMVELSGQLGWTDGLAWDVLMQLEGIDPATWSNLPQGGLSAAIASSGRVDGEEIELQASMTSLSGELAGYSVTGGGEIDYYPGQLEIRDFFLITGRNRMEVHGTAGDNIDVTLMVDGQDLSQIFEPLAGQLEIAASVAGTKEKPVVTFSAGAVDIAYLDYALNTLNANGSVDKEGGLDVRLAVEHLSKDNSTIEALNLSILGSFENHTIIASALSDFGDLTSSLTGQLLDDRSWEGSIDDLDYVHPDYGRWQQEKQSRVAVSPDRISLDDICIASSGQRMCAGASWSSAGSWHAELSELQLEMSKLKDWDIIDVKLSVDEFSEEVTGAIRLHGDLQGAEIVEARITTGKEMVELSGQLGWTDGLAWDVLMQLEGIDPATWSNLPQGGLSAAIASSGRVDGEEIELQASMTSLSGELAGYSVTGGGEIDYYPGQLEIRDFFLITGRNRMEVHGTAGDNIDVTLMVDGQDLSQIFEPLAGQLEIAASVAGTKEKPVVTFSAGAVDIAYLDYALNTLNANGSVDKEGGLDVRLAVEHLSKDNSTIEALNLSILGSFENHTIIASALSDFGDLTSSLTGQLLDDRSWEGSIDDLDYVHPDYGRWQQEKQSRVAVSPDRISLDDICIASSGQRMCAGASWSSAGSWHAELSELQLEMSKLKDWDIIDVELAGDVLGNVVLDGVGSVVNNGAGALTVSKLYAPLPENDLKGELELIDTQLTFSLHDQILKAALRSSSGDGSTIDMGLSIRQFGELSLPMSELPLEGSVRADIVDVTLLKQLSGDMLVPSGQLSSDVTISGTFQRPLFEGKVSLVGGEILFPDLGLLLSDIALVLDGDKNGLTIDLLAHSGDGQVTGTGVVFLNGHDWRAELSIRGDNLQVLELREMRVSISPDLDVRADSSGVTLTGRIEIPRARIEPEKMIASDSTSRDTVFIDDIGSRDGFPYQFDVAVVLGDDVMVEGYGFSGFFVGNLDISGAADREIRGVGKIQVSDGFFSVRERVLDISRGRLLFDGGPVDNPELDIQARKTIKSVSPGTTDVIVGVNITGTAQDYFIELLSAPPMNDRDILSYIALGRPFRQGDDSTEGILNSVVMLLGINRGNRLLDSFRGRGLFDRVSLDKDSETSDVSLVVDRRLSDRVTIGYDFNLFDNAGQFRFHYNLREGFSLEVRNSVDSSGVELLYSVER